METHAIDLDDVPDEDLGNRPTENGHDVAVPMSEDRDPDNNGVDEDEQPHSTNGGEGVLFSPLHQMHHALLFGRLPIVLMRGSSTHS